MHSGCIDLAAKRNPVYRFIWIREAETEKKTGAGMAAHQWLPNIRITN